MSFSECNYDHFSTFVCHFISTILERPIYYDAFQQPAAHANPYVLISGSLVSSSVVFQAGETALLPCDISVPPNSGGNDELTLVMWYREDVGSPIYSIGNYIVGCLLGTG